ncbi:hypothetical protein D3C81_1618210 [compost metagenome]
MALHVAVAQHHTEAQPVGITKAHRCQFTTPLYHIAITGGFQLSAAVPRAVMRTGLAQPQAGVFCPAFTVFQAQVKQGTGNGDVAQVAAGFRTQSGVVRGRLWRYRWLWWNRWLWRYRLVVNGRTQIPVTIRRSWRALYQMIFIGTGHYAVRQRKVAVRLPPHLDNLDAIHRPGAAAERIIDHHAGAAEGVAVDHQLVGR